MYVYGRGGINAVAQPMGTQVRPPPPPSPRGKGKKDKGFGGRGDEGRGDGGRGEGHMFVLGPAQFFLSAAHTFFSC